MSARAVTSNPAAASRWPSATSAAAISTVSFHSTRRLVTCLSDGCAAASARRVRKKRSTAASADKNTDETSDRRGYGHCETAADGHAQRRAADGRTTESAAHGSEYGEADQRQDCDRVDSERCRDDQERDDRYHCEGREAGGGDPRRLERPRQRSLLDPQLVSKVRVEPILRAELLGDLDRQ